VVILGLESVYTSKRKDAYSFAKLLKEEGFIKVKIDSTNAPEYYVKFMSETDNKIKTFNIAKENNLHSLNFYGEYYFNLTKISE
jgi:hypothetical protein